MLLAACASAPRDRGNAPDHANSAAEALKAYFAWADRSDWPRVPAALPWPKERALTRIAVASCRGQDEPAPILDVLRARDPDLFLYIGDNVYGDVWSLSPDMEELMRAYAELSEQRDFQRVAAAVPIMATWDDHDYGMNDGGRTYYGKYGSEAIFETYWGMEDHPVADRDGVYYSETFGPEGQRVQIIMLDTRFFRTDLTRSPNRGAAGMERYVPSDAPDQDMLGPEQWAWLEAELRKPADLRLLVSSVQVLADVHGWEAWKQLPRSQARLYEIIETSGANGVILVSGDRHLSALYRQGGITDYPLYELTASSLNRVVRDENDEMSSNQLGPAYARENFGEITIDWSARQVSLTVHDMEGDAVLEQSIPFADISLE
ncbi:alkaline phosphatase D family protein [Wenzhouxiangella marina]|nr:alkaline phosphatase D family protein [Wenzhouxiangella marina]